MAQRSLPKRLWYQFLQRLVRWVGALVYRLRSTGLENIPSEGGVLVVSNHQSHLDPPIIGACCPRRMNALARDTLFRFTPFAWLLNSIDVIPIDNEGLGLSGIKESLKRLKRGEMLLIFPEGKRTENGEVGRFLPGFTTLAVRSGAAILPVAIEGAFDAWPRWRKLPRLGTVHVHFGPPLRPEEIGQSGERDFVEQVEERVRQCHAELRRRPVFAGHRRTPRAK